jgi:xanthine dehydrogenase small subunit
MAVGSAMEEIAPIDDVRGSARYKRILLGRLIRAHFLKLCPQFLDPGTLL